MDGHGQLDKRGHLCIVLCSRGGRGVGVLGGAFQLTEILQGMRGHENWSN